MTHLLTETLADILESGHTPADIVFIGSVKTGHRCTWEEFQTLADVEYDASFGAAKVATDLVIIFSDGTNMIRGEYDGSEWWQYYPKLTPPEEVLPIRVLTGASWPDLADLADTTDTHHNPALDA